MHKNQFNDFNSNSPILSCYCGLDNVLERASKQIMAGNSWLYNKHCFSLTNTRHKREAHTHRMTNEIEIELFPPPHSTIFIDIVDL